MSAFRPDGRRRDALVHPYQQHAAERGDEAGEGMRHDAMQVDVEAERVHAPGIVADRLQRQPEGRARDIDHREVAGAATASDR